MMVLHTVRVGKKLIKGRKKQKDEGEKTWERLSKKK
jgi:hypothetical protein